MQIHLQLPIPIQLLKSELCGENHSSILSELLLLNKGSLILENTQWPKLDHIDFRVHSDAEVRPYRLASTLASDAFCFNIE